jgi:hypothetical protein
MGIRADEIGTRIGSPITIEPLDHPHAPLRVQPIHSFPSSHTNLQALSTDIRSLARELKADVLARELLVDRGKSVELVFERSVVFAVEETRKSERGNGLV